MTGNEIATKKSRVIALNANTLIQEALRTLAINNIISAPVIDTNNNRFIGFLDLIDIASYAWHVYRQQSPNYWSGGFRFSESSTATSFFSTPVRDVINFSWWNQVLTTKESDSLADVIETFSSRYYKPHRVGVLDSLGQFTNIITQTDLVQFAFQNIGILPFASKTVSELGIARPPILIPVESSLIDTINVIVSNRVSGLGLIDQRGKLAANFSASDLRGMVPNTFNCFNEPALTYLSLGRFLAPITCSENTLLSDLVSLFAREKIHRVYVVDEERVTGVISLSDIIPLFRQSTKNATPQR